MNLDFAKAKWINKPALFRVSSEFVSITTEPKTDFWQRSYYGFRNDNAPALLFNNSDNFTLTVKTIFKYQDLFDQCGLIIYLDNDNWFKASIEYENIEFARLGSVVTNNGYSDWATTDIQLPSHIWYRLSRRGADFLIESSLDGTRFKQMRIFHLHSLGETTVEMGKANPPLPVEKPISFGFYACSPSESSFQADFSDFKFEPCIWQAHGAA